jgi:cyclopropane-fatty-acyl-phospholipid synthase
MKADIIPVEAPAPKMRRERTMDRISRRLVLNKLQTLQHGGINLVEDGKPSAFGGLTRVCSLEGTVRVHHPRFYSRVALGGTLGAAEAYMEGLWSSRDLTAVIRILLLNEPVFRTMETGWARLTAPLNRAYHFLRRNTPAGSRANILAHYDLGNDFYRLFLDETLTYSAGIFETEGSSLAEASIAKYRRICEKLQLTADDHVVEIGTGWGGFAIYAAQYYGCRVTTTTISKAQYELAAERIREADLSDRITLLSEDYRNLTGRYDKLVSIEMIEAVGHQYLDTFFETCSRLLREDGMMAIQAITMRDQAFEDHKRTVDFIKRYIFPGSCIPSITAMTASLTRATDLRLFHLEDITPHYARTLREWRERFFRNINAVRKMGFPETFIRMWDYYLSYCEAGFAERYIGNVQMVLTKPLNRRDPLLPPLEGLYTQEGKPE